MHIFKNIWNYYWPVCILALLSLGLIFANIRIDGSWFLGWDSTTPEINFGLNFGRFLSGVWQEYRGLGTTDGMAHTALIVHWIYSAILSLIFPAEVIRPLINHITHLLGGIGIYALTQLLLQGRNKKQQPADMRTNQWIGFTATLLGMFNFMTMQMYNLPLELFSFHFAVLPWTLWALTRYIQSPTHNRLLILSLISLAGVSQAHVPTIFVSYLLFMGSWSLGLLLSKYWRSHLKSVILAFSVLLLVNSFWLLPYSFAVVTKADEISSTKQNRLGTPSVFYKNSAWGTAGSILAFGGFQLDYLDWHDESESFQRIMSSWHDYWNSKPYQLASLIIMVFIFLGIASPLFKTKNYSTELYNSTLISWSFAFIMLGTSIPIIGFITETLRDHIPLFAQIFRFTFTKFSLGYVVFACLLFALGLRVVINLLRNISITRKIAPPLILTTVVITLFVMTRPTFKPMYYEKLFVNVPQSYFDFASYANENLAENRYATLPMHSLWGWTTNTTDWGYRGSGFLWQLATPPMVDRAFDPWSKNNETAFFQLNNALYANNPEEFKATAQKYHLTHLLWDTSVFNPGAKDSLLLKDFIPSFFQSIQESTILRAFENLTLFSITFNDERSLAPIAPHTFQEIDQTYNSTNANFDQAYFDGGDYILQNDGIDYPFSFLSQNEIFTLPSNVLLSSEEMRLFLPRSDKKLFIPDFAIKQPEIPVVISLQSQLTATTSALHFRPILPSVVVENKPAFAPTSIMQEFPTQNEVVVSIHDRVFQLGSNSQQVIALPTTSPISYTLYELGTSPFLKPIINDNIVSCEFMSAFFDNDVPNNLQCQTASFTTSENDSTPLSEDKQLFALSFSPASTTGGTPEICVATVEEPSACLNDPVHSALSEDKRLETTTILLNLPLNQEFIVYFLSEYEQNQNARKVAYQNFQLLILDTLTTNEVAFGAQVENMSNSIQSGAELGYEIELILPISNNPAVITPDWKNKLAQDINCSINGIGAATVKITTDNQIIMNSEDGGIFCNQIPLTDFIDTYQYLYQATGNASQGAGTKIFLMNPFTTRPDLETITNRGGFSILYPILPSSTFGAGDGIPFTLSYNSESYRGVTNETSLESERLIPIPLRWLSAMKLESAENVPVMNGGVVRAYNKLATFLYTIELEVQQSGKNLVALPQSHDPGWVAFPGWRFWERFEHVKYNGWANGWLIPGNAASATQAITADGESGSVRVTILYWPQLLSYAGYGLLLTTLLLLGVGAWRERNTPVQTGDNSIIVDMESESTKNSGHSGKTAPHFTPLSIEKLFTGGTIGADWKIFQQEFKENTAVIANDLRTGWHKLQQAVRKVLRGRAN